MAKRLEITLCNTCVRDNYGQGIFAATDSVEEVYRKQLKGLGAATPEFRQQNCFNFCEHYHCVEVKDQETAYLFKKVSDPDKIHSLCEWVKTCTQSGKFEVPESLKDQLLETQKISS